MRRHGFSSRRFSVSIDEIDEANTEHTCRNPCRVFALPIFLYMNVATTSALLQYTAHWTMYRHWLYGRYQAASIHATRESRVKRVNMVGECECLPPLCATELSSVRFLSDRARFPKMLQHKTRSSAACSSSVRASQPSAVATLRTVAPRGNAFTASAPRSSASVVCFATMAMVRRRGGFL